MNRSLMSIAVFLLSLLLAAPSVRAEGDGQNDLNEALRVKITAEGLRELNRVVELLESALEKGLDVENSDFAEQVLSETLLERASQLGGVVDSVPGDSLADPRMQRILALAVSDLRRVLDYDNPPPQALAMLARLLTMAGDEDSAEARELLDKLVADERFAELPADEQADALALRAGLQSEASAALADYARAIELAPDKAEHRLSRAQFQFEHEDVEGALAEIAAVVEQTPDQAAARLLQAQIFKTLKRYEEALATLDKLIELKPDSPVPYQYRGEVYREMGQFDKAVEEFTHVLALQPGMDLALIRRAEAYYFAGKLDEALADIDAVLADNPGLALAHGLRAQVLAGKENFTDAIAEMKLLASELPGQPDVRMHLALYYLLNDQPREAIAAYTEVLELDGDHFLALRSRGDAYLNVGDHAAAIADFDQALKLDGDDSALLNNLAWVLATSPDDTLRDGKRAIELATKACELTEYKASHILSTMAAAHAEAGDFEVARKWSRQAVDMNDPEHIEQLKKELASYEANQPWRERQTEESANEAAAENDASGDERQAPQSADDGDAADTAEAQDEADTTEAQNEIDAAGDSADSDSAATDAADSNSADSESADQAGSPPTVTRD